MDYIMAGRHKHVFDDKLALRAARIAFHIDKNGIKKTLKEGGASGDTTAIDDEIARAVAQKETYSARLTGLRLHHQLTMLQIAGYKDLARELAYCD